ncbi:Uncharacterised protein [uncultured archaeon]|nr:Uncharacterised protein [uncultured archaeon]
MGLIEGFFGKGGAGKVDSGHSAEAVAPAGGDGAAGGKAGGGEAGGRYNEPCSLCNGMPTDRKWAGKYWHKKCMRKMKHVAKGML